MNHESRVRTWLLASRPKTLLAIVVPVMLGSAIAFRDGVFDPVRVFVAFMAGLFVQVGTNFFNDYADYKLGADTDERKGPTRAVATGLISPRSMLIGTFVVFGLALVCAALLVRWAGWPMLVLGLASVICGFWYTAGRWSLAYLGLGEIFVVFWFGLVATGATYYVQALALPWYAWAAGLMPGLLSTCLIVVNNWRDIAEDRLAGKKTLAVRFGASFAFWEVYLCLAGGLLTPVVVLHFAGQRSIYAACLALLILIVPALFFGCFCGTGLRRHLEGRALVPFLGFTAALLFGVGLLFSIGWIIE